MFQTAQVRQARVAEPVHPDHPGRARQHIHRRLQPGPQFGHALQPHVQNRAGRGELAAGLAVARSGRRSTRSSCSSSRVAARDRRARHQLARSPAAASSGRNPRSGCPRRRRGPAAAPADPGRPARPAPPRRSGPRSSPAAPAGRGWPRAAATASYSSRISFFVSSRRAAGRVVLVLGRQPGRHPVAQLRRRPRYSARPPSRRDAQRRDRQPAARLAACRGATVRGGLDAAGHRTGRGPLLQVVGRRSTPRCGGSSRSSSARTVSVAHRRVATRPAAGRFSGARSRRRLEQRRVARPMPSRAVGQHGRGSPVVGQRAGQRHLQRRGDLPGRIRAGRRSPAPRPSPDRPARSAAGSPRPARRAPTARSAGPPAAPDRPRAAPASSPAVADQPAGVDQRVAAESPSETAPAPAPAAPRSPR